MARATTATHRNYVNGAWIETETGETFQVRNPAAPDEVVGEFQRSNAADAEAAIEAAVEAQADWAATPGPQRGRILRGAGERLAGQRDELAETLTREEGKTLGEATGEVQRAIDICYYYAEKARDFGGDVKQPSGSEATLHTVREPVGVTALITPWNYPIAIPAWKIAPALATGNAVVFKPASQAPTVARELVAALDDAGLPDGVLNLVTGPGSEVGETFVTHEDVDAVSFTGSAEVGMNVYRQATSSKKRVQTEMGGKNPTLVTANADLEAAVDIVAGGAFGVTGQACTATSRAIVHEAVHDEFLERLIEHAESLDVGPGLDGADMGPQVSEDELEGTLDYIEVAEREGATLETGGHRADGDGYFVEPTVFSGVDPDFRIAQEEVFGPVLAVMAVRDFDEALAVANDVQYGLSAGIVTTDLEEANRFAEEIEAGIVKVNDTTTGVELHVPFGGFKRSSSETFREQGDAAIDFYTISKTVYMNY